MTSSKPKSINKQAGRIYGGLSLEDRKKQRREQFLQAGINVFGTSGFRSATVRSLCKEAKLTDLGYQNQMADAILRGIRAYFAKNPPLSHNPGV